MIATISDVLEGRARWTVLDGDCLAILPTLPPKSVAHVITDPPYSEHVHDVGQVSKDHSERTSFGFAAVDASIHAGLAAAAFCAAQRWSVVFCDAEGISAWRGAFSGAGVDPLRVGAWIKPDAMPQLTGDRPAAGFEALVIAHVPGRKRWNGGGRAAVWTHCIERADRAHPTQKPVSLMLDVVADFTDPGEVVLDPFTGSGTTGVACLRLGRRFIGIEKDPKYATLARERLEAESKGLTLRDARAGQLSLLEGT